MRLATHCHCPLGIFTQVRVHRSCTSRGLPNESVPSPRKSPVVMTVSPNTDKFRSLTRMRVHLAFLQATITSALLVSFSRLLVITKLSASNRVSTSALQVRWASSNWLSSLTTLSSVDRVPWATTCRPILSETTTAKQNIAKFRIASSSRVKHHDLAASRAYSKPATVKLALEFHAGKV